MQCLRYQTKKLGAWPGTGAPCAIAAGSPSGGHQTKEHSYVIKNGQELVLLPISLSHPQQASAAVATATAWPGDTTCPNRLRTPLARRKNCNSVNVPAVHPPVSLLVMCHTNHPIRRALASSPCHSAAALTWRQARRGKSCLHAGCKLPKLTARRLLAVLYQIAAYAAAASCCRATMVS